jgi:hypothetical protein
MVELDGIPGLDVPAAYLVTCHHRQTVGAGGANDRSTQRSGLWPGFGLDVNAIATGGLHIAFTASRPRLVPVDRPVA